MTGTQRRKITPGAPGSVTRGTLASQLRSLLPPVTPRLIFRALLGVLLFFCGIVLGAWLLFRFRRDPLDAQQ